MQPNQELEDMSEPPKNFISEEDLSEIRSEMWSALNLFLAHMKYTITFMSSMIAVGLALASFSAQNNDYVNICMPISFLLIGAVFPISRISKKIVYRYYKIYVSNYIYSARVHERYLPHVHKTYADDLIHPWHEDLKKSGFVTDIFDSNAIETFIECRKEAKEEHSWYY